MFAGISIFTTLNDSGRQQNNENLVQVLVLAIFGQFILFVTTCHDSFIEEAGKHIHTLIYRYVTLCHITVEQQLVIFHVNEIL